MPSDGVIPVPLKLEESKVAEPGKFRVLVLIDSEIYQLGTDQDSLELALYLYKNYGKVHPFQICNDKGQPIELFG